MVTAKGFDSRRAAHPRLARARARLGRSRASFLALLDTATAEALAARPPAGGWSVLETLEHVARVERSVVRLLQSPPTEHTIQAVPGLLPGRVRQLPVAWRLALLARGIGRAVAPKSVQPQRWTGADTVRDLASATRAELLELTADVDPGRLAALRFPHQVLGSFDGFDWIDFLAAHEQRHLRQARRRLRA